MILFEKEKELGGILKSEQAIPFKYEMYDLTRTLELAARKAGVEIQSGYSRQMSGLLKWSILTR